MLAGGGGARAGDRVRVRGDNSLGRGGRGAGVDVRAVAAGPVALEDAGAARELGRAGGGEVRDDDDLVHLRRQGGQAAGELLRLAVRDDDGGDLHGSPST